MYIMCQKKIRKYRNIFKIYQKRDLGIMSLFCKIGLHWMRKHSFIFTDVVSGKPVYSTECPCGRKWMVDTLFSLPMFKVEHE